jgi:catechol 2,3-dioxygenase-like lactoylglutathione lyase family enzyme
MAQLRIDHVIYGVRDLNAAAEWFARELGFASYPGGRHTGRGTGNVIVPLGHDYVELLGIVDTAEAAQAASARALRAQIADGDRLTAWCLSTDDLDEVAGRLGLTPADWSRELPDGTTLRWRLAGREVAMENPTLPFFISWQVPEDQHPSCAAVPHRVRPIGIAWIEVAGDRSELERWLGGAALPVRLVDGPSEVRAVGIRTADGELVIRSSLA